MRRHTARRRGWLLVAASFGPLLILVAFLLIKLYWESSRSVAADAGWQQSQRQGVALRKASLETRRGPKRGVLDKCSGIEAWAEQQLPGYHLLVRLEGVPDGGVSVRVDGVARGRPNVAFPYAVPLLGGVFSIEGEFSCVEVSRPETRPTPGATTVITLTADDGSWVEFTAKYLP